MVFNLLFTIHYLPDLLSDAITNGCVPTPGSNFQTIATLAKPNFDVTEAAVVALIGRNVSNDVLRPKLFRDTRERSLERKNISGEERRSPSFRAKLFEVLIAGV
jgi:hypothetical protein